MNPTSPIVLTTDFGLSDYYVGVMKGVILGINPHDEYETDVDQPHQFVKGGKVISELF